jgi:hypothetical protein
VAAGIHEMSGGRMEGERRRGRAVEQWQNDCESRKNMRCHGVQTI